MHSDSSIARGHPRPETRALWTMHTTCQHDCCRLSGIGPLMVRKGILPSLSTTDHLHKQRLLIHSATSLIAPPSFPWPGRSCRPAAPPAVGVGEWASRRRGKKTCDEMRMNKDGRLSAGLETATTAQNGAPFSSQPQLSLRIGPRQDVLLSGDGTGASTQHICSDPLCRPGKQTCRTSCTYHPAPSPT